MIDPDIVQVVALPITVVGFFLAMIEMFYPRIADGLENLLDKALFMIEDRLKSISPWRLVIVDEHKWVFDSTIEKRREESTEEFRKRVSVYLFLFTGSFISGILLLLLADYSEDRKTDPNVIFWEGSYTHNFDCLAFLGLPLLIIGFFGLLEYIPWLFIAMIRIPIALSAAVIAVLNNVGKGKATGAIGIILAILGLLGECYQVYCIDTDAKPGSIYWILIVGLVLGLLFLYLIVKRRIQ